MALEQVFDCPRTLMRLRTGPLGKFLEKFCHWLLAEGFSRGSIRKHLSNVSHLNEYLGGHSAQPLTTVTAKDIEGFLKAYPPQCRNHGSLEDHLCRVRYSINRFTNYLGGKGLFDPLVQAPIYQELLDDYLEWLRHYQHAADGTVEVRAHSITRSGWGTGLTNWTYYDMDADVIRQRGETCHDKPDWMRPAPCIM
jgi:hypothetical protein